MSPIAIACIIGTRPEVIKMAPVIRALREAKAYQIDIIVTAQHRGLLDDMMRVFELQADIDCNIMQENQGLSNLTGHLFMKLGKIFTDKPYQLILAQGDTTTTMVAAIVAFYNRILYGHIEAGLRSFDLWHPFPEEMNRVMISKIASMHFAPTLTEKNNLIQEGIADAKIAITGNTVIDALQQIVATNPTCPVQVRPGEKLVLLTLHRRESFGEKSQEILSAVKILAAKFTATKFVYPVHPNPRIRQTAYEMLQGVPNIDLIDPLPYDQFVGLLKQSHLILTDSGGLQEEGPALNIPVVILRDVTERPLVVEAGVAILAGTKTKEIIACVSRLLQDASAYQQLKKNISPYGDGQAAQRIVTFIQNTLDKERL